MVEKIAQECAWHSMLSKMFACSVYLDHKGDSWGVTVYPVSLESIQLLKWVTFHAVSQSQQLHLLTPWLG